MARHVPVAKAWLPALKLILYGVAPGALTVTVPVPVGLVMVETTSPNVTGVVDTVTTARLLSVTCIVAVFVKALAEPAHIITAALIAVRIIFFSTVIPLFIFVLSKKTKNIMGKPSTIRDAGITSRHTVSTWENFGSSGK